VHIVVMAGERWSQPQFVPHKRWWGSAEICTSTRCLELCSIAHFPVFFFFPFANYLGLFLSRPFVDGKKTT